jgi:lipoprotein-anchoring transpeptidase ErfK/SrfK
MQQLIRIDCCNQVMHCYFKDELFKTYPVSTGKNGLGELKDTGCTPRGWHYIYSIIGLENEPNSVFVARKWTQEIYTEELSFKFPERDWILTRILQLDGLEPGFNKGGNVDSLSRYIYIHGTPDTTNLGVPGSKGCIRMRNSDIIELANWIKIDAKVLIL